MSLSTRRPYFVTINFKIELAWEGKISYRSSDSSKPVNIQAISIDFFNQNMSASLPNTTEELSGENRLIFTLTQGERHSHYQPSYSRNQRMLYLPQMPQSGISLQCQGDPNEYFQNMKIHATYFKLYENRSIMTMYSDGSVSGQERAIPIDIEVKHNQQDVTPEDSATYILVITNRDNQLTCELRPKAPVQSAQLRQG